MEILANQIKRQLEIQNEINHCGISEQELQRIWPLNEKDRERKIAQFAKDYGFQFLYALAVLAFTAVLATNAFAQSAKEIRGASPYVAIKNEPAPKLIVDPPLPEGLAIGVVWIQYRVENLRIVPVLGEGATKVSPRVGHLHITVDDLPWWWADTSDSNTIDIAGLPVGQHKVRIELVDANHKIFPGQTQTVTFKLPVALQHQ